MKTQTRSIILIVLIILLFVGFYYFWPSKFLNSVNEQNTENIQIKDNVITLDSLTLKQKIAQMIIVRGDDENLDYNNLNVGGIFLDRQLTEEDYKNLIKKYQNNAKIQLLVSTDLEGSWSPFHEKKLTYIFPYFSDIKDSNEAYKVGKGHGEILNKNGFNLNFAPVSEFSDEVYGGRAFSGTNNEIKDKLNSYIKGLQEKVLGTCKHYPGKAMIKNLHYESDIQTINKEDLELFDLCIKNNVSAIMISHHIVNGEINSNNRPSTVSKEVISKLNNFDGLIVADEINMNGLKMFYPDKTKLYVDLINAGENVILDFRLSPVNVYKLLEEIEVEVKEGRIDEEMIDKSVRKILKAKGYKIKTSQ
jgi:beta-N-acetylhexosaminidase